MRILLVEDDINVLEPLTIAMQRAGFEVVAARTGAEGWNLFKREQPDFAILDVTLPGMDGLELTRRIGQAGEPRVPIIVLTGREQESDKVAALDLGADDYVVKPCSHRELLARIRAVWRRAGPTAHILTSGSLTIDTATHQVFVEGRRINVTANEFVLLRILAERAGHVVRISALMTQVWGSAVSNDLLRVTVFRLRHKIEPDPKRPRYIHTVPGIGFMLRDAQETEEARNREKDLTSP